MEAAGYKDRSGGLVFFGILHILLGLLVALLVLMTVAASEIASRQGSAVPQQASIAQNLLVYAIFGAYAFSVGVGSIRARRWARALAVAVSWIWLITGIVSAVMLAIMMPHIMVLVPPSSSAMVIGCLGVFIAAFYILLPIVFILFYQRADVRATCEARDPRVRWTDRAPLPVLALSLMFAFAAVVLIGNVGRPALPIFGRIISGAPAALTFVALAGLLGWIAVQLYRLKESAWWVLILLQIIGAVFAILTFARTDFNALMTPQLRAMHLEQMFRSPLLWSVITLLWIGYFGFLIWVRRYFK